MPNSLAQSFTMDDEEKHLQCKRCGQFFDCKAHDIELCQCSTVKLNSATLAFLQNTTWGCLCSNCLLQIDHAIANIQGKVFPKPGELVEGRHYYEENGLWVFTEHYHMLRGTCCKSGCRHCAYGFEK